MAPCSRRIHQVAALAVRFSCSLSLLLGAVSESTVVAGSFQGLGASSTIANAISADGSTVVGYLIKADGFEAIRWTAETGIQGLGDFVGGIAWSEAMDVSADGSVVVGYGSTSAGLEAFRWTSETGLVGLGNTLNQQRVTTMGTGVSADGQTIVGTANFSEGGTVFRPVSGTAFRWTGASGMQTLPDLPGEPECSRALGLSPDASIIVGVGNCGSSPDTQSENLGEAVRFALDQPAQRVAAASDESFRSMATAVSASGYVVGYRVFGQATPQRPQATRWDLDGIAMALAPNALTSEARDVSADGQTVVGQAFPFGAMIWDSIRGARDLKKLLVEGYGQRDAEGWTLRDATSISADGRTIAGNGRNPSGESEAWVAHLTLDTPGDFFPFDGKLDEQDLMWLTLTVDGRQHELPFDVDGDTLVTEMDRRYWVEELAHTYFGDSDLNGEFSSTDLLSVFQAGKYEDAQSNNATWSEGDWDGNWDFDSSDLLLAFQSGGYEQGPRDSTRAHAVPEPAIAPLIVIIAALVYGRSHTGRRRTTRPQRVLHSRKRFAMLTSCCMGIAFLTAADPLPAEIVRWGNGLAISGTDDVTVRRGVVLTNRDLSFASQSFHRIARRV